MKLVLILTFCLFIISCTSSPSMEESEAPYESGFSGSVEDTEEYQSIDDIADVEEHQSTDDMEDIDDISHVKGKAEGMVEGNALSQQKNMAQQARAQDEEIRKLRLEVDELKALIAELRYENESMASGYDKNFNMQASMPARPVDLVMRFNTMKDQKHWWNKLDDAGITDKFHSSSKGRYMIFLGHFNDHKIARITKNKISTATGARTIEIVTSSGG